MNIELESSWKTILDAEIHKPYFQELTTRVHEAYLARSVFPLPKHIFRAFALCPFDTVKVVILGQDPYHGPKQAHGLSFSVSDEVPIPPSLRNIYKEIESDLKIDTPQNGNLIRWAEQGVLLLNATLTVEEGRPGSHQDWGWEQFTDAVIETLSKEKEHVVFMLWGKYAEKKTSLIDSTKHLILTAPHPSPLSAHRGFFGCKHFSKANEYLTSHNRTPIHW